MTVGHRESSGSARPRQNSSAVAAANIAVIAESIIPRKLEDVSNAGMRQANSHTRRAKTTTSGRTLRPSKARAPAQVNP
jgi:hypothetical protein